MSATAEQIKRQNPIDVFLESRGIKLVGGGGIRTTNRCAMLEHKKGHLCVSVNVEKGLWNCHDCKQGGDVISWMALESGKTPADVLKEAGGSADTFQAMKAAPRPSSEPNPPQNGVKPTIKKTYQYKNALGEDVFQAVRLEPKSFRQRHVGKDGKWVWTMEGIERVLYRLPEVLKAKTVAICEGEKDAETLVALGYCGTCNVGGAGKWMDGYTESLAGKEVLIFGDNDKPGQDHVKLVFESIAGRAAQVKIIKIPNPFKDVTEYVESFTDFKEAQTVIAGMVAEAHPFIRGVQVKWQTMADIEPRYRKFADSPDTESFNIGRWLPSFTGKVRNLIPGELVLIIGDTGVGKTMLLQNIALAAAPLPTLMFEMELPAELLFERFICARQGFSGKSVEEAYSKGDEVGRDALNHCFPNLLISEESAMTAESMETMIISSELKLDRKPVLVLVDYAQLIGAKGSDRYEKASYVAEALKRIAKDTRTIIVVASQRKRPKDDASPEIFLHDAKDSGSLENSSGLVLGVWRDPEDRGLMHVKVLKNTKGTGGLQIQCNIDGERMRISERAQSRYEP